MAKIAYKWKNAARSVQGLDAEVFGSEIAGLARTGSATPDALVDAAWPKDSPLHEAFTWDNSLAAEKWRLEEARCIIRALVTVEIIDGSEQEIRAFVSVQPDEAESRIYHPIKAALSDKRYYQQVLDNGLRDAGAYADKYRSIRELSKIVGTIDRVLDQRAKQEQAA